ncbi:type IV secretion protein Rhs [Bacillus safensis]|uniref:Type IV secretion protein Rhs n=1 Tax=Bacillus safensis TaxID=561879 RepID=A0A5S9MGP7_BACIA|nr:type IV secretion protein Rhs [Bacillus safensis]
MKKKPAHPYRERELTYEVNGKKRLLFRIIQMVTIFGEGGIGNQPSHHNVRPEHNTRNGKVEGVEDHYYFERRNNK